MSAGSGLESKRPFAVGGEESPPLGLVHGGPASRAEARPEHGTSGAAQAGMTLAEALLRHSEGRSVHRFIPWSPALGTAADSERGRPDLGISITELAERLRTSRYLCLHSTAEPVMDFTSQLRHRYSSRPFPVTSSQYAVSYPRQIHDIFVRAALSDLRPYDAFLCPSRCSARAMENRLDYTMECLREEFGLGVDQRPQCAAIPHGVDLEVFRPREKRPARRELSTLAGSGF